MIKRYKLFLEHVNSDQELLLTSEDISSIKDMFQDILDDYDIDKNIMIVFRSENYNARYDFSYLTKSGHQWISEEDFKNNNPSGFAITIHSPVKDDVIISFPNVDQLQKDIDDFINRLKSAGYDVKKSVFYVRLNVIDIIRIEIRHSKRNDLLEGHKLLLENRESIENNIINDIKDILIDLKDEGISFSADPSMFPGSIYDDNEIFIELWKGPETPFTIKDFDLIKEVLESMSSYIKSNDYSFASIKCKYILEDLDLELYPFKGISYSTIEDIKFKTDMDDSFGLSFEYIIYEISIELNPIKHD